MEAVQQTRNLGFSVQCGQCHTEHGPPLGDSRVHGGGDRKAVVKQFPCNVQGALFIPNSQAADRDAS